MAPMALLTLPTEVLREATLNPHADSPHGERNERAYALALMLLVMGIPMSALLLR